MIFPMLVDLAIVLLTVLAFKNLRAGSGGLVPAAVLIAHGANVNDQNTNGMNALHIAASNGDVETAKVLVEHGADLAAKTPSGATALALAKFGPTLQSGQKDPRQDYEGTAKLLQEHEAP